MTGPGTTEPTIAGEADVYYTRLANAGITAADYAGTLGWLTGYRFGRDNQSVPDRLLGNSNVTNGYAAGVHDR